MCRNIKNLFNFDPPATDEEIHNASLQFVRKLSGFNKPSEANKDAFNHAVDEVSLVVKNTLGAFVANAEPRDRRVEAAKARERSLKRFGQSH